MKATKNTTTKNVAQFDQVARFNEGDAVEISTTWGWTEGIVTKINRVDFNDIHGYHYNVSYVPKWEKNGRVGLTVCSGGAIRSK